MKKCVDEKSHKTKQFNRWQSEDKYQSNLAVLSESTSGDDLRVTWTGQDIKKLTVTKRECGISGKQTSTSHTAVSSTFKNRLLCLDDARTASISLSLSLSRNGDLHE